MDSSCEDLSAVGVNRFGGEATLILPPQGDTDNNLLLRQRFIDQKGQLLGEVSPWQQREEEGQQEMVVTTIAEAPSSERSGHMTEESDDVTEVDCVGGHVTEESQSDTTESQLVPNPGYSEEVNHDKLRPVSKDWVLNQLQRFQATNQQNVAKLSQQMAELKASFEKKEEELECKQRELEESREEVKDLKEKLEHEISTRRNTEQRNSDLEDQLKMNTELVEEKSKKVELLEVEVKRLREELKKEKDSNRTAEALDRLTTTIRSQHDLLQDIKQDLPSSQSDPGPLSPTDCYPLLRGKQQQSYTQETTKLVFSPELESPTWPQPPRTRLQHQTSSSVD